MRFTGCQVSILTCEPNLKSELILVDSLTHYFSHSPRARDPLWGGFHVIDWVEFLEFRKVDSQRWWKKECLWMKAWPPQARLAVEVRPTGRFEAPSWGAGHYFLPLPRRASRTLAV